LINQLLWFQKMKYSWICYYREKFLNNNKVKLHNQHIISCINYSFNKLLEVIIFDLLLRQNDLKLNLRRYKERRMFHKGIARSAFKMMIIHFLQNSELSVSHSFSLLDISITEIKCKALYVYYFTGNSYMICTLRVDFKI
jgi:hypothetical protein